MPKQSVLRAFAPGDHVDERVGVSLVGGTIVVEVGVDAAGVVAAGDHLMRKSTSF